MLFILGALLVLVAALIIPGLRMAGRVNTTDLGWMSDRWLAEQRASRRN